MSNYKPRRPAPPPPNMPSQKILQEYFERVDANKSGSITPEELQSALSNGNKTKFNINTVKMMIGMFDSKKSGEISRDDFAALWRYIVDWQNCFKGFDKDKSGSINLEELQEALTVFGYNLSPHIYQVLIRKFDRTGKQAVMFDDFIECCVVLHNITEVFRREDVTQTGVIQISYEKFLEIMFAANLF